MRTWGRCWCPQRSVQGRGSELRPCSDGHPWQGCLPAWEPSKDRPSRGRRPLRLGVIWFLSEPKSPGPGWACFAHSTFKVQRLDKGGP